MDGRGGVEEEEGKSKQQWDPEVLESREFGQTSQ